MIHGVYVMAIDNYCFIDAHSVKIEISKTFTMVTTSEWRDIEGLKDLNYYLFYLTFGTREIKSQFSGLKPF